MNDNFRNKCFYKQIFAFAVTIFLAATLLSGCTETLNTGSSLNSIFIGTWTGSVEVSTFGGFMSGNSTFNKLTFTQDIVFATLSNERGTNTMNYTYVVEGNNLVLKPLFFGEERAPNRQLFNDTRPSFNNTMPQNITWPLNDTQIPFNNTWPSNNEQQPGAQQPPSMSLSFSYSFDEKYTILYLNGSKFIKIE